MTLESRSPSTACCILDFILLYNKMEPINVVNLVFLFFLMLGLGLAVDVEKFKENFKKPKGVTIGVLCQFFLMPPLSYFISGIYGIHDIYRVALCLIGCCPGGAMSNIVCFLVRADLDLSVAMTTASSFCAIFMMPLNIFIYVRLTGLSDDISLDYVGIVISALLVVVGLGGGISIKRWAATNDEKGPLVCKIVGKLGGLGGFGVVLSGMIANSDSETPLWGATGGIYGSAATQVALGIMMGFGFSKLIQLRSPSCVAVSIETSVQNAVLAMAIIAISFNEDDAADAAVVPMCYMFFSTWTNILWGFLAWKVFGLTDLPKEATISDVIASYKKSMSVNKGGEEKNLEGDTARDSDVILDGVGQNSSL